MTGHILEDLRDKTDYVSCAKEHYGISCPLSEVHMPPGLCCGACKDQLAGSRSVFLSLQKVIAEFMIEVCNVSAWDGFLECGVYRYQNDFIRFRECGRKFLQKGLCPGIAVWLEHDPQAFRVQCTCHGESTSDLDRMVRVVRYDDWLGPYPFEASVRKRV